MPLLQPQNSERDGEELRIVDLEQLLARIIFQDRLQRLVHVAARQEAGTAGDVRHLAPQQRNRGGTGAIRDRGEQAQEAQLPVDLAARIEPLHADVIEVTGAMHGGAHVGLGEQQQRGPVDEAARFQRNRRERLRVGLLRRIAQDAETRVGHGAQSELAVVLRQVVFAVAEKAEMVVVDPLQESAILGRGVGIDREARPCLAVAVARDDIAHGGEHGLPVMHREPHIAQDPKEPVLNALQFRRFGLPVHLHMHVGFEPPGRRIRVGRIELQQRPFFIAHRLHHGMHDEMQGQALPVHFHGNRVDQEGHVVVDDFHHRVARLPAVLGEGRVVHAHFRRTGREPAQILPVRQRSAVEIGQPALGQIVGVELPVVFAQEWLDLGKLLCGQVAFGSIRDRDERLVDNARGVVIVLVHVASSTCPAHAPRRLR